MSYSAHEIEDLRNIIAVLYLSSDYAMQMTAYEKIDMTEKMLNTYMSQSVTYADLQAIFSKQIDEEKKSRI